MPAASTCLSLANTYVADSNGLCVPRQPLPHPKRATWGLYVHHRICLIIIRGTSISWAPTATLVLHWTLDINKPLGMVSSNGLCVSGEVPMPPLRSVTQSPHVVLVALMSVKSLPLPPPHVPVTQAGQPCFLRAPVYGF